MEGLHSRFFWVHANLGGDGGSVDLMAGIVSSGDWADYVNGC